LTLPATIEATHSMEIRIIATPPGEAPLAVRRAWVGLVLPLRPGETGPSEAGVSGVLTGPRGLLARIWRLLTGQYEVRWQYLVLVDDALDVLEEASPEAAAWWRENTPHLIGRGRSFGFTAEVCEELDY
jgi:hypothetical protein